MLRNAFEDWRNSLGKFWSILQIVGFAFVFVFVILLLIGVVLLIGIVFTDMFGITHFGAYTPDNRTYEEKQMDAYRQFELECVSREYTKDQCLLIWSEADKDD